jgi:Zn-dependent peptidase ImmA (M78 family)
VACNAIAGEFLAPADAFQAAWDNASPDWPVRLAELARRFHISQLVVARRALDLGLINRETYYNFYLAELERFRQAESQGGSYYRNAGSKNSTRFAKAVIAEAFSGRLLLRDAGKLLGVQPANLRAFAEQLGP